MEKIESKLKSLSRIEQFSLDNLSLICKGTGYQIFGYTETQASGLIKISFLIDLFYMDDIIDIYGLQFIYFFDRNSKIKIFFFDAKSGELIHKEKLIKNFTDEKFTRKFFAKEVNFYEDEYLSDELDLLDYVARRPNLKFSQKKLLFIHDKRSSEEKEESEKDEWLDEDDNELSILLFKKGKKLYKENLYKDALKRFNMAFYKCSIGFKYEYMYLWWWAACLFNIKDYNKCVIIYYKALHRMKDENDIELCKRQIECAIRRREKKGNELKIKNIFGL